MQRNEWKFQYQTVDLADGAKKKLDAHKVKLAWWELKKAEVMAKVRESGIEIHDSVAASYSNTKGGFGPQITIDDTMQRDLTECQVKILEHSAKVKEYGGWLEVLNANKATMVLNHDDWLFFFGE